MLPTQIIQMKCADLWSVMSFRCLFPFSVKWKVEDSPVTVGRGLLLPTFFFLSLLGVWSPRLLNDELQIDLNCLGFDSGWEGGGGS